LNEINLVEQRTRFEVDRNQTLPGVSSNGITTGFPLSGSRSFYGAAKLASELMIEEYVALKNLNATVLRCGVIAGPGQFGKVDQGVLVFWLASHLWKKKIGYFGFGGEGKQVRDFLHIDDLFDLVNFELQQFNLVRGQVFNAGGGAANSASLQELTTLCEDATGNQIDIQSVKETRVADIPYYVTDNTTISSVTGWNPKRDLKKLVSDTYQWMLKNEMTLKDILTS
jgi:CDP-paratose 2-epimerase